ncbi:MAG: HNH endonuclease [Chthoniobacteraceae bacterium]
MLAQFDMSFLVCLQDPEFRSLARRTLIAGYFEPTERAELYTLCGLPVPPDDIIAADATRFLPSDSEEKKRDVKFSMRVLPAYDFTCALTRYRMIAIDGTTSLDAAHIHQFKRGGTSHPTNGIALSKTAHWLFDRGYWSLDDECRILVAAHKFDESGEAAHLLKPRANTPILLPPNPLFHPDQACLRWHRERHGFAA